MGEPLWEGPTVVRKFKGAVVPISTFGSQGIIVLSPYKSTVGEYKIPTIVFIDGFEDDMNDYLRHRIIKDKVAESSAEGAAKVLRIFARYRRRRGLTLDQVNDKVLLEWQAHMTKHGVSVGRRDHCISTVHGFYEWCELDGRLRYHVQIAGKHSYAGDMYGYAFPITSKEKIEQKKGIETRRWVSTVLEGGKETSRRHTPTSPEIERLFEVADGDGRYHTRNSLMMSWALETGGRVSEIVPVAVSDLPSVHELQRLLAADFHVVKVKRKNRGWAELKVPIDLVLRTIDFVENDKARREIIEVNGLVGRNDVPVFLSERGRALSTDSVTRICRELFAKAGISRANIHRLRAKYITVVIERCMDALGLEGQSADVVTTWTETILFMAAELMGHIHPRTLAPYLNAIRSRRVAQFASKREPQSPLDPGDRHSNAFNKQLRNAADLIKAGRREEARAALRGLTQQLDQLIGSPDDERVD